MDQRNRCECDRAVYEWRWRADHKADANCVAIAVALDHNSMKCNKNISVEGERGAGASKG